MVGGVALGVGGAGVVSDAGVKTVSVSADLCDGALGVRGAADFDAADLRISGVAFGAEADRLVVVDEALGVSPAVAGVHAVAVEAGLGLPAVIICGAANNNNRFRFNALDPRVSNVARRTRADRLVVVNPAEGVGGARVGDRAGVEALPVDAGGVQGALRVVPTLGGEHGHEVRRDLQALNSGVSCVSDGARAAGGVASGLADGVGPARVHATRVPTRAIVTLVRVPAVTVRHTGRGGGHFGFTFSVRSDERVIWTRAENSSDGRAVRHSTRLCWVTRSGGLARILATVVNTSEPWTTVIVNSTL